MPKQSNIAALENAFTQTKQNRLTALLHRQCRKNILPHANSVSTNH